MGVSLALLGCSDDSRPSAPGFPDGSLDAGSDANVHDVSADSGSRGDVPVLPEADIDIVLPYGAPPHIEGLVATADPAAADIVFLIDTTSSFDEEIDNLQEDLNTLIVPGIRARIGNSSFGVAEFEDFPAANFGSSTDRPYTLHTAVTSNLTRVRDAVAKLDNPLGHGGDYPESGAEALYQAATGSGYVYAGQTWIKPYSGQALSGGGTLGGVGFRPGALHVIIQATDAPFHTPVDYEAVFPGTHSLSEAIAALNALDVFVLGIVSDPDMRDDPEAIALATDATIAPIDGACPTGINGQANPPVDAVCPLVFDIDAKGSGVSDTVVDAVVTLVNALRFSQVYAEVTDDPLGFVNYVEATTATAPPGIDVPLSDDLRAPFDGRDDTFVNVGPGVSLTFSVSLENTALASAPDYPHIFRVPIEIIGDGIVLATHVLRIIVPATNHANGMAEHYTEGP